MRQARVAGHFGEWLQGRMGPHGPVALVSVQCPIYSAKAALVASDEPLSLDSPMITPDRAQRLADALGVQLSGRVVVAGNMPLGAGLGGSTSALLALAKTLAPDAGQATWIKACLAVEGASDPLAFPQFDQLLWASRQGHVLGQTAPPPAFQVVGGLWGQGEKTDPADQGFDDISDLWSDWQRAVAKADAAALGALATESARRCTSKRGPVDDPSFDLARDLGALGVIRAHTGSARGLLFGVNHDTNSALSALSQAGYSQTVTFTTGGPA